MKTDSVLAQLPNSWGKSELTRFFDHARKNQVATYLADATSRKMLEEVDKIFHEVATNLSGLMGEAIAPLFVLRSHCAFRAAAELAFAGHNSETFVLIRSALEYAGYGLLVSDNQQLADLWIARHIREGEAKKIARAFSLGEIRAKIASKSDRDSKIYDDLYQRSIDFGGHPNAHAVNSSMRIRREDREILIQARYLHDGDTAQRHAMRTLGQSGVCCLGVFHLAFEERFSQLKIGQKVKELLVKYPL